MPKRSSSSPEAQEPSLNPLEQMDREVLALMRASGRTVTVMEPSDWTEYVVTFPRNRGARPTNKPDLGQSKDLEPEQRDSSGIVNLDAACKVLVKSRAVRARIKRAVGQESFEKALTMMRAGNLEGDIGAEIHDLLTDAIGNEFKDVWSGVIHKSHDDYPMGVREYHGVYVAWALEYSPVRYFLNKDSAIYYAESTWNLG